MIALALAGSGAGVVGYWAINDGEAEQARAAVKPIEDGVADDSIVLSEILTPTAPARDEPADETIDGPSRVPAVKPSLPLIPKPQPDPRPKPPKSGGQILEEAAFIVRFNDNPEINRCLQLFRKDKAASRAEFAEWASKHPALDGLSLERVNYSGEAILSYRGANDANPASSAKAIQARLNDLPFVRYADPDYTAFPGKGE